MLKILRLGFCFPESVLQNVLCNRNVSISMSYNTHSTLSRHQIRLTHQGTPFQSTSEKHRHLICLKDWSSDMIMDVICSAMNLKNMFGSTHGKKLDLLKCTKVMILEDHNEPILRMAVSKAVSILGASDVHIVEKLDWEHDFNGRVFSEMADTIFVSSETHGCLRRFAHYSLVPVVCMRSRKHACIQALATIMSIIEDYGQLKNLNLSYVGAPHQVLNDYLTLCPKFGANLKFKCCCSICPVSPLLLDTSKSECEKASTNVSQVTKTPEALNNANVVIAGRTTQKKEKIPEFVLSVNVSSSDHVCRACWDLVQSPQALNQGRLQGHRNICLRCGRSLAARASHALHTNSIRESRIYNVIQEWIIPRTEISKNVQRNWTFYHTFPRGPEVDDELFFHERARTFNAFRNMQFISAALIFYILKSQVF